jgi:hypothetical protein
MAALHAHVCPASKKKVNAQNNKVFVKHKMKKAPTKIAIPDLISKRTVSAKQSSVPARAWTAQSTPSAITRLTRRELEAKLVEQEALIAALRANHPKSPPPERAKRTIPMAKPTPGLRLQEDLKSSYRSNSKKYLH